MLREIVLIPALFSGLLAITPTPASAMDSPSPMEFCGERAALVKSLLEKSREHPTAVGQIDGSAVIEVLVSDTGSWTMLATGTDGRSCVVSAGEGWEQTRVALDVDA